MKFKIQGPPKYLIASILFGIFSIPMFVHAIYLQFTDESPFFAFSGGFMGFTLMMLWFWYEYKKTGNNPLQKTRILFIGYTFTWLGVGFTQALLHVEKSDIGGAFVAPIISIIIGVPLLFSGIRIFLNSDKKDKLKKDKLTVKIINFVIGFAIFAGLSPIILLIIGAYYIGNYIIASIILAVLSFFVWLFWFLFKKKKNKGKTIDAFHEEKEKNKELKLSDYINTKNKNDEKD